MAYRMFHALSAVSILTKEQISFSFVQIFSSVETPQKSFCFQWFATSFPFEDEGCKTKVWKGLLKAEQQVVYEWFDRIRCGLSVEAVGQHLPADLRTMEFEDKMTWLLSRWHCLISIVQSPNSLSNGPGP